MENHPHEERPSEDGNSESSKEEEKELSCPLRPPLDLFNLLKSSWRGLSRQERIQLVLKIKLSLATLYAILWTLCAEGAEQFRMVLHTIFAGSLTSP